MLNQIDGPSRRPPKPVTLLNFLEGRANRRRSLGLIIPCLLVLFLSAGCASTQVTDRERVVTERLPRPETIWVYDFAATPADLPVHSTLDREHFTQSPPQTAEQIAEGRKVGTEIEKELVSLIREMGLTAEHAIAGTTPRIDDIVIQGYLLSYDEGSTKKRVAIGLGAGGTDLKVAVEGFQQTAQGLRLLGSGTTESESGKTPGGAVGLAAMIATHNPAGLIISTGVKTYEEKTGSGKIEGRAKKTAQEIADVLKQRFIEEGWID